jgi:outer membrane protein
MRMKSTLISLICIVPLLVSAQATRKLKLEEAIKLGQEQSKTLKISQSKMAVMNSRYDQLKDQALPNVNLSAGYARFSDIPAYQIQLSPNTPPVTLFPVILNNYSSRASVSESVFNGFRLKNGLLSEQYLIEASKLDYEKDKSDIIFNIINAYYNLYKVQASKKIIEQSLAQAAERLKEVKNMELHGIAIHNDVLRVELQNSNIELSEIDVTNNLEVANFNFGILCGLPEGTRVEVDSLELFKAKDLKAFPEYLKVSLEKRSDFRAAELRRKSSEASLKVTKGALFPTLNVGANYYYSNPNPRYIPPADAFHDTWDVGFNLNWNLTSLFSNRHQSDEAKTMILQSTAISEQISDGIRMEVNQDFVNYEQSLRKTDVARRSVSQASENYRTMLSKYNNSTALLSDLLDADVLLLQAKLNLAYSNADTEIAYNHLLKSTGTN